MALASYETSPYLTLTNRERRENVAFLCEAWKEASTPVPLLVIDPAPLAADAILERDFFKLLCYHAMLTQPAPEAVAEADWRRMVAADVITQVWRHDGSFNLKRYVLDPPCYRNESKGKVLDFIRISASWETFQRLLPQPNDPDVTVDVIFAASGGILKSRSFSVVADMIRAGYWRNDHGALSRFAMEPSARTRKRAVRMGLVDLPERADTFADMKAMSRALHAIMRLGDAPEDAFAFPISRTRFRCEVCDAARMASCPIPHCRWRRQHAEL